MKDLEKQLFAGRICDVRHFFIFTGSICVDLQEEIKNITHPQNSVLQRKLLCNPGKVRAGLFVGPASCSLV